MLSEKITLTCLRILFNHLHNILRLFFNEGENPQLDSQQGWCEGPGKVHGEIEQNHPVHLRSGVPLPSQARTANFNRRRRPRCHENVPAPLHSGRLSGVSRPGVQLEENGLLVLMVL